MARQFRLTKILFSTMPTPPEEANRAAKTPYFITAKIAALKEIHLGHLRTTELPWTGQAKKEMCLWL
jgi:hypothetical protein